MNFDFTKFATMSTNSVGEAFGAKPQDVIGDIASEVARLNGEELFCAPDVVISAPDVEEISAPDVETSQEPQGDVVNTEEPKVLTPDEIKEQAEFLKQQKAKSDAKEEQLEEKTEEETKPKKETKPKAKKTKKEEPVVYSRPRKVVAYGDEVYVEENPNASLEDIRKTLVTRFGYSEFKDSSRCQMRFDARTGEVYPEIIFNKKG